MRDKDVMPKITNSERLRRFILEDFYLIPLSTDKYQLNKREIHSICLS